MRITSVAITLALLTVAPPAGALFLDGGPSDAPPGAGTESFSGSTDLIGAGISPGATISYTGIDLDATLELYFGVQNDSFLNGFSMEGALDASEAFAFDSKTANSITYTATTSFHVRTGNSIFTNYPTGTRITWTLTRPGSFVEDADTIALNNASGDVQALWNVQGDFSVEIVLEATAPPPDANAGNFEFGRDLFNRIESGIGQPSRTSYDWGFYYTLDNDGDGLGNSEEQSLGTNPDDPDTDGDGLRDDYELAAGLDPLVANTVNLAMVPVGDPGNADDSTGFGAVGSDYQISQHEITVLEYALFLNAVADSDTFGLFHNSGDSSYKISRGGTSGSFYYNPTVGFENTPINFVSLYDAMRFVNWIENGQPVGAQNASTTEDGAYTITGGGVAANSIVCNPSALHCLPSEDEWYKAAYYDTNALVYYENPGNSDDFMTCSAPGATPTTANCNNEVGNPVDVGGYTASASPNQTFDQGGNVWEWVEDANGSNRRIRGGAFDSASGVLSGVFSGSEAAPSSESDDLGFRVTMPEPHRVGSLLVAALALQGLQRRRRSASSRTRAGADD